MTRKAYRVTPEAAKQFMDLYKKGYTIYQIGDETGWGRESIRLSLHKSGINLRKQNTRRNIE
jgi:hypothetical protein